MCVSACRAFLSIKSKCNINYTAVPINILAQELILSRANVGMRDKNGKRFDEPTIYQWLRQK